MIGIGERGKMEKLAKFGFEHWSLHSQA